MDKYGIWHCYARSNAISPAQSALGHNYSLVIALIALIALPSYHGIRLNAPHDFDNFGNFSGVGKLYHKGKGTYSGDFLNGNKHGLG